MRSATEESAAGYEGAAVSDFGPRLKWCRQAKKELGGFKGKGKGREMKILIVS